MTRNLLQKLRQDLRNAFSLQSPYGPLTDEDRQLLAKVAGIVVARQMAMPAILFLGSIKPLNTIASQAMVFLQPFLSGLLFKPEDYQRMAAILDRREGIEALMEAVESAQELKDKEKK